jgi:adenylate cyclase
MKSNFAPGKARPRRPLFQKYFAVLLAAVAVPLLASGAGEAGFGYLDQRREVGLRLRAEAAAAAARIQGFLDGIPSQLNWTVQTPWAEGVDERHRSDALRLMQQAPAVAEAILVDGKGVERLRASRTGADVEMSGVDHFADPAFSGARASHLWWGPVTLHSGSEPYMAVAVAGPRASAGVTIAQIDLKPVSDVISAIRVGETGQAFVLDDGGNLVAHPDISMVGGEGNSAIASLRALQAAALVGGKEAVSGVDAEGRAVLAAGVHVSGPDWTVFVEQPVAEAYGPIRAALWRTGVLLLAGAAFAAALAYWLARRMIAPIRRLEEGAARIGAGHFDQPIEIRTGDELERLGLRVNEMAEDLASSKERTERVSRLARFLSPEAAEFVEKEGQADLLEPHRAEVAVIFCDLRGFTAFAGEAPPDEVMGLLAEYHQALGKVIVRYEATLTCFMGDGLMLLINAPLPLRDPATHAARMAIDMQAAAQALIAQWRERGHRLGFGVGIATGEATVGRIGYDGRIDYTAIGRVVNLASRLCSTAADGQVIVDPATAAALDDASLAIEPLGEKVMKGLTQPVPVFSVTHGIAGVARRG